MSSMDQRSRKQVFWRVWLGIFGILGLVYSPSAMAQPQVTRQEGASLDVNLEVGQTQLIRLTEKIIRVYVADAKVADVQVITSLQVLVTGKSVGYTHVILWGAEDKPLMMAVNCRRNLSELRNQLKELFPQEKVNVSSAGDLVVLSGKVTDLRLPSRLAEVAKLHAEQLANLVEVMGDQQVQLEVRFAEVSRTGLRKMGFNFLWRDGTGTPYVAGLASNSDQAGSYLAAVPCASGDCTGAPLIPIPAVSESFSFLFSTGLSNFPFSAMLNILKQNGVAKVLAEPVLVALSGQEASFHAGGEVPVMIPQQLGSVRVEYKKFGVQLRFLPTVLGDRTITMKVFSEVSEPDASAGVNFSGYQVPGFKTRNNETTVRLKDGQSFAIAGLLSDSIRSTVRKVPLLGDIPILGALFRSTAFQREESELLVVIRAHLVQPLQAQDLPRLPGEDDLNDPDDFQLFILGQIDGWKKESKAKKSEESSFKEEAPVIEEEQEENTGKQQPEKKQSQKDKSSQDERMSEIGPEGSMGFIID